MKKSMVLLAMISAGCAKPLPENPPAQGIAACQRGQVQVLMLGTFHFSQQDAIDILAEDRQVQLTAILDRLSEFEPDVVAVEAPYSRNDELDASYQRYLDAPEGALTSKNEVGQIGFRLARRLGHEHVYGVDVPMKLWHDSIQIFDDEYPRSRERLRRRWSQQWPDGPDLREEESLAQLIRAWNTDPLPGMPEYGRFMPLVEGEVYAGALKLRPWYDRNLRIVQNFFRVLDSDDERLFMVVGASHLPVLRHIVSMTPQLCVVDPLPYLP